MWALAAKRPKTVRITLRSPSMSKSTAKSAARLEDLTELVEQFLKDLERQEAAPRTRASYRLDLLHFFRWFEQVVGDASTPEAVTSTDVREYRGHLLTNESP